MEEFCWASHWLQRETIEVEDSGWTFLQRKSFCQLHLFLAIDLDCLSKKTLQRTFYSFKKKHGQHINLSKSLIWPFWTVRKSSILKIRPSDYHDLALHITVRSVAFSVADALFAFRSTHQRSSATPLPWFWPHWRLVLQVWCVLDGPSPRVLWFLVERL